MHHFIHKVNLGHKMIQRNLIMTTRRVIYITSHDRGSCYQPHIMSPEQAKEDLCLDLITKEEMYQEWSGSMVDILAKYDNVIPLNKGFDLNDISEKYLVISVSDECGEYKATFTNDLNMLLCTTYEALENTELIFNEKAIMTYTELNRDLRVMFPPLPYYVNQMTCAYGYEDYKDHAYIIPVHMLKSNQNILMDRHDPPRN